MKQFERRLDKLESRPAQKWGDVRCLICQGKHYDELTPEQQVRYCEYIGTTKDVYEECNLAVVGNLHIPLERKPEPPTPSKLRQIIDEVEKIVSR